MRPIIYKTCCLLLWLWLLAPSAFAAPRFGLLWWPADPSNPANPFIETMQECLHGRLAAAYPDGNFIVSSSIRDLLFPYLEPATQPTDDESFAELLSRDATHARLIKHIDYLVTFTGETVKEKKGGILCGAGYGGGGCLGLAWTNKDTQVRIVIWDLGSHTPSARQETRAQGTSWMPAFLLPIPIPALTEREACLDISRQLTDFIDESLQEPSKP